MNNLLECGGKFKKNIIHHIMLNGIPMPKAVLTVNGMETIGLWLIGRMTVKR